MWPVWTVALSAPPGPPAEAAGPSWGHGGTKEASSDPGTSQKAALPLPPAFPSLTSCLSFSQYILNIFNTCTCCILIYLILTFILHFNQVLLSNLFFYGFFWVLIKKS